MKKCNLTDCPCKKSVQPITDVVDPRGKDWPGKTPPRTRRPQERQEGSWIITMLDEETQRKLIRRFPRIRRHLKGRVHENHKHPRN